MTELTSEGDVQELSNELSNDLPTITAEINAYKRVAAEAIISSDKNTEIVIKFFFKTISPLYENISIYKYVGLLNESQTVIDVIRRKN